MTAIGDVVSIARQSISPEKIKSGTIYVGLENIEADGNFLGVSAVEKGELASSKFCFGREHVLFGKLRPYLKKTARPNFEGICSTDILPLKPSAYIDRDYLFHVLRVQKFVDAVSAKSTGANLPRISPRVLAEMQIPLPPLPEQRRIAAILDKADALRAKRRAAIAKLDQLLQSVFLEMFGDPVTNPKEWSIQKLDSVCSLVNGRAFKPEEWEEVGLPIVRIQNLNDSKKAFNYTTKELPEKFRVRKGDTLFSWSGTPGTSFGCFRWDGMEGWLNQHIFNVRLNGTLYSEFFIAQVNLKINELIAKAHGGVGLQHVTKGMVDETLLMIPPLHLQHEFSTRINAIHMQRSKQASSLENIDALFASLQCKAFAKSL